MPFPTHTSPILHLSLVWQGFLKVEDFVSDLQLFPWNKFLFTKISHYHGNYREAPKMYLFFLYSTYSRVTANGHRNYIKNYFQGRERATHPLCHSFLSILVCRGGRLNGQPRRRIKPSVQTLLVTSQTGRDCPVAVCARSVVREREEEVVKNGTGNRWEMRSLKTPKILKKKKKLRPA